MQITSYNNSEYSAHANTSQAHSIPGKPLNFLNHYTTSLPQTSMTTSRPLFPPAYAHATNGGFARILRYLMVLSTSKPRSNGRKAAPLSLTSNLWPATSSASPAEHSTSSYNISSPNILDNFPSHNSGAISTPTYIKLQQTSPYMPPTMTLLVSSTQSHKSV